MPRFQSKYKANDFQVGEKVLVVPGTMERVGRYTFPTDEWVEAEISHTFAQHAPTVNAHIPSLRETNFALDTADLVKVSDRVKIGSKYPDSQYRGMTGTLNGPYLDSNLYTELIMDDQRFGRALLVLLEEVDVLADIEVAETEPLPKVGDTVELLEDYGRDLAKGDRGTVVNVYTDNERLEAAIDVKVSGSGHSPYYMYARRVTVVAPEEVAPEEVAPKKGTYGTSLVDGERVHGVIDEDGDFAFLVYDSYDGTHIEYAMPQDFKEDTND